MIKEITSVIKYAVAYFAGFLVAFVTDPIVTSLVIGCVLLGAITNAWIALIVFFLGYALLRTLNSVANAIGLGLRGLARSRQTN